MHCSCIRWILSLKHRNDIGVRTPWTHRITSPCRRFDRNFSVDDDDRAPLMQVDPECMQSCGFFSRRLEYRTPLLFISLSEFPGLVSVPAISVGVHGNLEQTANSYIVQDDTLKSKGRQIPTGSNNAFAVWCFGKMTFLFLGRAIMFHPTGLPNKQEEV